VLGHDLRGALDLLVRVDREDLTRRDLADLGGGGYALDSVEIFDFYPQTYHVESLAVLSR